jgi:hypothetical protein
MIMVAKREGKTREQCLSEVREALRGGPD